MVSTNKLIMIFSFGAIAATSACTDKLDSSVLAEPVDTEVSSVAVQSPEAGVASISYSFEFEPEIAKPLTVNITVSGLKDQAYQVVLEPGEGLDLGASQDADFVMPGAGDQRRFPVVVTPQMEGRTYLGVSVLDDTAAGQIRLATQLPIQLGPLAPYRASKKSAASAESDTL